MLNCNQICNVPMGGAASAACLICKSLEQFEDKQSGRNLAASGGQRRGKWIQLFNTILTIIALYLSFKCNKGINLGSILLACCCSPFYIAYRLAIPC